CEGPLDGALGADHGRPGQPGFVALGPRDHQRRTGRDRDIPVLGKTPDPDGEISATGSRAAAGAVAGAADHPLDPVVKSRDRARPKPEPDPLSGMDRLWNCWHEAGHACAYLA